MSRRATSGRFAKATGPTRFTLGWKAAGPNMSCTTSRAILCNSTTWRTARQVPTPEKNGRACTASSPTVLSARATCRIHSPGRSSPRGTESLILQFPKKRNVKRNVFRKGRKRSQGPRALRKLNTMPVAITNIFVLMLENRAFDHMLGFSGITGTDAATGSSTSIHGLSGNETNTWNGETGRVSQPADNMMAVDPGHEFTDVLCQLAGANAVYAPGA